MTEITANDPNRKTWVEVDEESDFPIQNLPFGIFSTKGEEKRVGVALGDKVIDVYRLAKEGYLDEGLGPDIYKNEYLNDFMSAGKEMTRKVRNRIGELFDENNNELRDMAADVQKILLDKESVTMHLPVKVGDYTDFYSSKEHATNVGTMFRDPDNALLPNWLHIPVGYHGRASSIVVSGTPIHRPKGQQKPNEDEPPVFGPCKLLDFELEMAFVTHDGNALGENIPIERADEHIFGMCLFNDWSARDIQKWEYVPLGPFLAKSFASSISPWIVTLDALEPSRCEGPEQNPAPLPYLKQSGKNNFDIELEVGITPPDSEETIVCNSNFKYMYWSMAQQLAHHSVNGCNIRCGDMMASGTISGPDRSAFGSMLEISWKGTQPVDMNDGSQRKFIQDGDTVTMRGHARANGVKIGFGEVKTEVLPAK